MAKAVGVDGDVTFMSGHSACFDTFDFTEGQRIISTTCFGDEYEDNTGGIKFIRFSASGVPNYDGSSTSPGFGSITKTGGAITFQIAPGCTIAFNGVLSDINVSADVNGAMRITFNGVGKSSAPVETWDEVSGS